jgi:Mrp family chromosome partitioning ATPase/capsular polysaccharide biosynthesis protein
MNETTDAAAIFAPIWKRKWLILAVAILVAAGTYIVYEGKQSKYSARALIQGPGAGGRARQAQAAAATQTATIGSPIVRSVVVQRLRKLHTPASLDALRGNPTAKWVEKTPFLVIAGETNTPVGAALLANETAQAYADLENTGHEQSVRGTITNMRRQLLRLEAALVTRRPAPGAAKGAGQNPSERLSTAATLQTVDLGNKIADLEGQIGSTVVHVIGPASPLGAQKLYPDPKKNAIFAFVIGLVLAAGAAYVVSRFDRRFRSVGAIESTFGTQILTVLPTVKRPIVGRDGQLAPSQRLKEPLRRLYTTMRLGEAPSGNGEPARPRVTLFISPDPGDGKSTVVADLALVQREAGERVAVIEADFRRPVQARLLQVDDTDGLVEVLSGTLALDDAMQTVQWPRWTPSPNSKGASPGVTTLVESRGVGQLSVLVSGGSVANPSALLASQPIAELLHSVAEDYDHVLIDARSPLEVSDALPLLHIVDAIVIVVRVGHTHEPSAERLVQLLAQTPSAPVLGVAANSVPRKEIKKYGFSSPLRERGWRGVLSLR